MAWLDDALEHLTGQPVCGYARDGGPAVEPTALAALALLAAGRGDPARKPLDWLATLQAADGSLGIDRQTREPCWPTGWAVLAWNTAPANAAWSAAARRAVDWILSVSGRPAGRDDASQKIMGHDTTLQGWPWVVGTHSWVEPTAINLLALQSAGHAGHARCREAVKLLLDRQLPPGGWNYGNTTVLGHMLRPHVQATGMALAALAHEPDVRGKVSVSIQWLRRTLTDRTTSASLSYALIGLAAHGDWPQAADSWLEAAFRRTAAGNGSPYHMALLVLAAHRGKEMRGKERSPLLPGEG